MMHVALVLVMTLAGQGGASVVQNATWGRQPTAGETDRFYPSLAQRRGISGTGEVACVVSSQGVATKCLVIHEDPPGRDFGRAAVNMMMHHPCTPKLVDGRPVDGGIVYLSVAFSVHH